MSKISKTWRGNRLDILDMMSQAILFLIPNILINRVMYCFLTHAFFITVIVYKYVEFIC